MALVYHPKSEMRPRTPFGLDYPLFDEISHLTVGTFVTTLDSDGFISFSTFVGHGEGQAIAFDEKRNIYVTGYTETSFDPTETAYQKQLQGETDMFVARITLDEDCIEGVLCEIVEFPGDSFNPEKDENKVSFIREGEDGEPDGIEAVVEAISDESISVRVPLELAYPWDPGYMPEEVRYRVVIEVTLPDGSLEMHEYCFILKYPYPILEAKVCQIVKFPGDYFHPDYDTNKVTFKRVCDEEGLPVEVVGLTEEGLCVAVPIKLLGDRKTLYPEKKEYEIYVVHIEVPNPEGEPYWYYYYFKLIYPYWLLYDQVEKLDETVWSQQVLPQYMLYDKDDVATFLFLGKSTDGQIRLRTF